MADHLRTFERVAPGSDKYQTFIRPFYDLPCAHVWRGYGSAIFLEFGTLHERGYRRDGSSRNPKGQWTLYLDYAWRMEGKRLIWCGSESDEERWPQIFKKLLGKRVKQIAFVGRLPEADLEFETGLHMVTFNSDIANPGFSLTKSQPNGYQSISSRRGHIVLEMLVEQDA